MKQRQRIISLKVYTFVHTFPFLSVLYLTKMKSPTDENIRIIQLKRADREYNALKAEAYSGEMAGGGGVHWTNGRARPLPKLLGIISPTFQCILMHL